MGQPNLPGRMTAAPLRQLDASLHAPMSGEMAVLREESLLPGRRTLKTDTQEFRGQFLSPAAMRESAAVRNYGRALK